MEPARNAPDYFDVRLVAPGPNRSKCFLLLKDILKCNAKEAKSEMDSGSVRLTTGSQLMIRDVVTSFEAIGAQLELIPVSPPGWQPPPPMSPRVKEMLAAHDKLLRVNRLKMFSDVRSRWGGTLHEVIGRIEPHSEQSWALLNAVTHWRTMNQTPLTFTEGMIVGCQALHAEVINGGLHQYFFNSSGNYWRHVLQILLDGNDTSGEEHFRYTMSVFPNGEPPVDRAERQKQLQRMASSNEDAIWEHFGQQTDTFYGSPYPTDETLWAALKNRPDEEFIPEVD